MRFPPVPALLLLAAACGPGDDTPTGDDDDAPTDAPTDTAGETAAPPGDDDDDDDFTTPPEEDCSGVGDTPTWEIVESPPGLVDEGLPWATVGDQIAGFQGVAWGRGRFVAVVQSAGEDVLRWATSTDGYAWELHELPPPEGGTTLGVSEVHFQGDQFVFFANFWGGGGWVYTSPDGLDWTETRVADSVSVEEFASDGGLTVVAGGSNALLSSTDLVTFTPRSPTPYGSFSYTDVAAGNGRVVLTTNGFVDGYDSADAVSWTGHPELQMFTVEFGRGMFAAFRYPEVLTSPDGVTFTPRTATGSRSGWSPLFTGGRFVTLGISDGVTMPLAASTDAVTWTPFGAIPLTPLPSDATSTADYHRSIACSACTCVFVGLTIHGHRDVDPWEQDNLPLIATARVLAAP